MTFKQRCALELAGEDAADSGQDSACAVCSTVMKISVVLPTYRRAESLHRCLHGLHQQTRPVDEVLVITQDVDVESHRMLQDWAHWDRLRVLRGSMSGQVNQLNVGLAASQGDVLAIIDDDAIARPDWLCRIEQHFLAHPDLGGVGGRDYVQENGQSLTGDARLVGTVQWFGRIVGNHHLGSQMLANVDVLKGVNMAYRRAAIGEARFDTDLRGRGAQTCNDMAFSMGIRRRGWRLLYDPAVAVDHFPATRFDGDQRASPDLASTEDTSFNFYLALHRHLRRGFRQRAALLWAYWVGTARTPGMLRGWQAKMQGDENGQMLRVLAIRAWQDAARLGAAAHGDKSYR